MPSLEHSGAPRGSIYHHFPGGRGQLLREATAFSEEYVARWLGRGSDDGPIAAIEALLDHYRESLLATDFRGSGRVLAGGPRPPERDCAKAAPLQAIISFPARVSARRSRRPGRRRILELLGRGPATIGELARPFGLTLNGVRKHVGVLEDTELVVTKKVGRSRECQLGPAQLQETTQRIDEYRRAWESRLDRFGVDVEQTKGKRR